MASIPSLITGIIRGTSREQTAEVNEYAEQIVTWGLPPYTDITRQGAGWATMAITAVGALVARPTTTAALEIYNNSAAAGLSASMIVDRLFSHWLVMSTTALGSGAGIFAMVTTPKAAPSDAALTINSLSGKPAATKTVLTAASTTVADNGWFPYGTTAKHESAGAVVPGGILEAQVSGRLVVPPGCSLCLHVVSGYTADTFTSGAAWYFKPLTLV